MKPSERRALEEEKRAQKEAQMREKEHERQAKEASRSENVGFDGSEPYGKDRERTDTNVAYRKLPEEEIEVKGDGYHREGFFGSHARLIAFIVCMVLILTVLGPWGIDMLVIKSRQEVFGDEVAGKKNMTAESVILLSELGSDMTWKNLENFSYTDYSFSKEGKATYIREYEISGTRLFLRVGGARLSGSPDYVRLIDYERGEYIADIRKESVRAFISLHTSN